jgi:DNA-K related protein/Hsp70 protein
MSSAPADSSTRFSHHRTVKSSHSPFLVGIDLGTTNSAVAFVDSRRRGSGVQLFSIPQLTEPSLVEARPVLPSFLYFVEPHEIENGTLALPWNPKPEAITGVLARERGALVPSRQVTSAKSWLVHPGVDRRAALLPWGVESGPLISPVDASARYLIHIRDAWNATIAEHSAELRLERQRIVLTVPASFDEEARELTVEAARQAQFDNLTLLEEPIAAFYAWMAEQHRAGRAGSAGPGESGGPSESEIAFDGSRIALVCDVGGGTTDFSLIRMRLEAGTPSFERIAIGDHLLLGGDNVDLALAALVERRMTESRPDVRLAITQRSSLRRLCGAAKEQMLGEDPPDRVPITILGAGRSVIGAAMTVDLTREDVQRTIDQFLPVTAPGDAAAGRDRRAGLRELGLPYESDSAITRHLAGFLARSAEAVRARAAAGIEEPAADDIEQYRSAGFEPEFVTVGGHSMVRPDLVLFNGGFFTPAAARARVVQALTTWFEAAPLVLAGSNLEAAVAIGAATYARLRAGVGPSMSLVKAGSGRGYYVGLRAPRTNEATPAVCVLARGTDEGTETRLDHPFTVIANRPISFSLYSSIVRSDRTGDLVSLSPGDDVHEHAPLVTVLRYGRKSRQVELPVRLSITFTELGTLQLWCESQISEHRWRLQFQLRSGDDDQDLVQADGQPASTPAEARRREHGNNEALAERSRDGANAVLESDPAGAPAADVVIPDAAIEAGEQAIRSVFENTGKDVTTETLVAHLEQLMGYGKTAWPLPVIRRFVDVLIAAAAGRRASASLEARWLNLFGFCFRPGFGAAKDPWRIGEARTIYAAELAFPNSIQNRVEWLVLWQRVAGGFSAGQQRELSQRVMGDLGILGRKAVRLNPQVERESWRLLATLERLDAGTRVKIGDELLVRIRRDVRSASLLWAIGRLGARVPLYGPLSAVVPPEAAARWVDALVGIKLTTPDLAGAIVQIGARTDDPLRELDEDLLERARNRLRATGISDEALRPLDTVIQSSLADANRVFGEPLPDGLRLGQP